MYLEYILPEGFGGVVDEGDAIGRKLGGGILRDDFRAGLCDAPGVGLLSLYSPLDVNVDKLGGIQVNENGRGCREHTNRAVTPTERSRAQKSCAPRSRDPVRFFDACMKSPLDIVGSPFSGDILSCQRIPSHIHQEPLHSSEFQGHTSMASQAPCMLLQTASSIRSLHQRVPGGTLYFSLTDGAPVWY